MSELELMYSNYIFNEKSTQADCHIYLQNRTTLHKHMDFFEFSLITKGKIRYKSQNIDTILDKNCLLFTKKLDYHVFLPYKDESASQITICMQEALFDSIMANLGIENYDNYPELVYIDDVNYNYLTKLTDNILKTDDIQVYISLIKHFADVCFQTVYYSYSRTESLPSWFIKNVSIMNENLSQKLKELLPLFDCSTTTLTKMFKQYTKCTPNEYFVNLKMQYAKNLLEYSNKSILEISTNVGFDSLSHFIHAFKNATGLTPMQYRKQRKNAYSKN